MTKRAVLLQALASTPRDIERLVRALPPEGRQWQPRDDWSVQQVLAHLVDAEDRLRARLERIRAEDNPVLSRYDPQDHAELPTAAPANGLLEAFTESRRRTLDFLTDLRPGEWQRPAGRNSSGGTTLRWQVVDIMNHDLAHLGQLVDIRVKWEAGSQMGSNGAQRVTAIPRATET